MTGSLCEYSVSAPLRPVCVGRAEDIGDRGSRLGCVTDVYSQLGILQSAASSYIFHMFVRTCYIMIEVSSCLCHSRGAVIEFTPLSQ